MNNQLVNRQETIETRRSRKLGRQQNACRFHRHAPFKEVDVQEPRPMVKVLERRYHAIETRQVNFLLRVSGNTGFSLPISLELASHLRQ